jgi:hypothetical protein
MYIISKYGQSQQLNKDIINIIMVPPSSTPIQYLHSFPNHWHWMEASMYGGVNQW